MEDSPREDEGGKQSVDARDDEDCGKTADASGAEDTAQTAAEGAGRLEEAEILLQRMHHAGMLDAPKRRPEQTLNRGAPRVQILIEGDDVTIIKYGNRRDLPASEAWSRDGAYGGYGSYGSYGDYGARRDHSGRSWTIEEDMVAFRIRPGGRMMIEMGDEAARTARRARRRFNRR